MYRIKILSPVHIWSGESFRAIQYSEKGDEVLIFSEDNVINSIKSSQLLNDELLAAVAYGGNRRSSYEKNLDYFVKRGIIDKGVYEKVKIKAKKMCGPLKAKEIKAMMRNMFGPYIPGSTIKGIIRTAVFYDYIINKDIEEIKEAVSILNRNKKLTIDDFIIGGEKKDIPKDFFRFISIKDVNIEKGDVGIYEESIFSVTQTFQGNVIEAVMGGACTEEFQLYVDNKKIKELDVAKEEGKIKEIKEMIMVKDRTLLSYLDEDRIMDVLYRYADDVIQEEIEYFSKYSGKFPGGWKLMEDLKKLKSLNKKQSPIIRIGKSSGYLWHTISLAVKKKDPNYYEGEFMKYIRPPKHNKKYGFPKTRKFVGNPTAPEFVGFAQLERV